jgi:hypothetical protein
MIRANSRLKKHVPQGFGGETPPKLAGEDARATFSAAVTERLIRSTCGVPVC